MAVNLTESALPHAAGSTESEDVFASVRAAAASAHSRHQFLGELLRIAGRHFRSPCALLHVRYAAQIIQDDCHFGPTDPAFWKPSVEAFLTDGLSEGRPRIRLLRSKDGQATISLLSAPVRDAQGTPIGAVALVTGLSEGWEGEARLATLDGLLRYASAAYESAKREPSSAAASFRPAGRMFESAVHFAFALTNEVRNRTSCEQAALGLVAGRQLEVLSVSGYDEIHPHGPGIQSLRAAMEECLDAEDIVCCPPDAHAPREGPRGLFRLHQQWRRAAGGDFVGSIPLRCDGATVAILSLRRPGTPFSTEELTRLRGQIEPLMPNLLLIRKASRGFLRHGWDSLKSFGQTVAGPGRYGVKLATALSIAAALVLAFGTMEYRVTVPCVVAPADMRHIAMPFEGILLSSPVAPGERVAAGQVLCELDRSELDRQRAELAAQYTVLQWEQDRAMAGEQPFEAQLARANQLLIEARLAIVERRLEQTVIRSPMDGVLVAGDLRQRIGEVLPRGETLFRVAAMHDWMLEAEFPQEALGEVRAGLSGVFTTHARPEIRHEFRLTRILPGAEIRNRRNVFVGEAEPMPVSKSGFGMSEAGKSEDWLRPGMEGVASVRCGPRRIAWILTHRMIDWVRVKLWL